MTGQRPTTSSSRAPVRDIADGLSQSTVLLTAGPSGWLFVTLKVLVRCPAAYPVAFKVNYVSGGARGTVSVPGFPGTGPVAYSGRGSQDPPGSTFDDTIVRLVPLAIR